MKLTRPAVLFLAFASVASGADYTVPGDFATIQEAINFAKDGDTIHVKPGTYEEILTLSENIRIVSTDGAGVTILTNELDNQQTILTIQGGVGNGARIEGFTFEPPADRAIQITGGSSPTVADCVVRQFDGRAVQVNGGAPVFQSTQFLDNVAGNNVNGPAVGAFDSDAEFQGCQFLRNGVIAGGSLGGAVYMSGGSPRFHGCTFYQNSVTRGGGSGGGALWVEDTEATIGGCNFDSNIAGTGGGIYARRGSVEVRGCVFYYNEANAGGGVAGNDTDSMIVVNCQFVRNFAQNGGGAALQVNGGTMSLSNATAVDNTADSQGAAFRASGANTGVNAVNAVVFGGGSPKTFAGNGASLSVTYSNIQGGHAGAGNIDQDPRFVSYFGGDFRLGAGSPGVDAGDNAAAGLDSFDIQGKPRFVDDPSTVDTGKGAPPIVDMGAHEFEGVGACRPDFDNNGVLDLFDFLAFVNEFNAGC